MATIDKKITQIQLDNRNFESNAKNTLSTVEKLKKSFNFESIGKSFSDISKKASEVDLATLQDGAEKVKSSFSGLEVIAITALVNITNRAIDAGLSLVKSLTLSPIAQGYEEYELKMNSIQTIMASTGAPLEVVNEKLEVLNKYADDTIYSFSDMTQNIGKFTNAGVGLDDAVGAIKGISNAAALSGANANEASRAMYNFAQALSQGHVKLIDWKSIENANMATVEFKQQLIDTAVEMGTLTKRADGMYTVLTKNSKGSTMNLPIDPVNNFNESLEYQWMTTEALIGTLNRYADETTSIGERALNAAKDIKTASHLIDTLQEAVGSGWGAMFEVIIGNFEEAKELWSGIGELIGGWIGGMFDAKIAVLKDWKELGGRSDLLEGMGNVLKTIWALVTSVTDAFSKVFPPKTGAQLAKNTKIFKDFTGIILKLAEALHGPLEAAFSVVFSVLKVFTSLGKGVFTLIIGLINILAPFVTLILKVVGGVLGLVSALVRLIPVAQIVDGLMYLVYKATKLIGDGFTYLIKLLDPVMDAFANLGDSAQAFLTTALATIDTTKILSSTMQFFKDIAEKVGSIVRKVFEDLAVTVGEWADKIKMVSDWAATGFTDATEKMQEALKPVKKNMNAFGEMMVWVFDKIKIAAVWLGGVLKKVFDTITRILGQAFEGFTTLDFENLVNVGVMASVAVSLKKFLNAISGPAEQLDKILESVVKIFDSVRGALEAYQKSIKAKTLLTIALAVGVLAASIWVLSTIDAKGAIIALAGITTAFGGLMLSMVMMNKLLSSKDNPLKLDSMKSLVLSMMGIATAVFILAVAVKKLADVPAAQLLASVAAIGVLMGGLLILSKKISSVNADKDIIKLSGALIVFGLAMNVMAKAVKTLGKMKSEDLMKGVIALSIIVFELSVIAKIFSNPAMAMTAATNIKELAGAVIIIAAAVRILGTMDPMELAVGLSAVGAALGIMVTFAHLLPKNLAGSMTGLIAMAGAVTILAIAVAMFGKMKIMTLVKGISAVAGVLGVLTVASKFMKPSDALGVVAMAVAINLLVLPVLALSLLPFNRLVNGLLVVAGALGIFIAGAMFMGPAAVGMMALATSFAVFGLAIGGLGTGIALIGVGLTAIGASASVAAVGIVAVTGSIIASLLMILNASGTAGVILVKNLGKIAAATVDTLIKLLKNVLLSIKEYAPEIIKTALNIILIFLREVTALAPQLVVAGFNLMTALIMGVAQAAPDLIKAFVAMVVSVLGALTEAMPAMRAAGVAFLTELLEGAKEIIPLIIELFVESLIALLNVIAEKGPELITAGIDLVLAFLLGIAENIPKIIMAGVEIIMAVVDGIFQAIPVAVERMFEAIILFLDTMAEVIEEYLPQLIESGINLFLAIVKGVTTGSWESAGNVFDVIIQLVGGILTTIGNFFGQLWNKGKEIVSNIISGLVNGVSNSWTSIKNAISKFIKNVVKGVKEGATSVFNAGKNLVGDIIDGILGGIGSMGSKIWEGAKGIGNKLLGGVKSALGIASPSKEFDEVAVWSIKGLLRGIYNKAKDVTDAGAGIGKRLFDPLSAAVADFIDEVNDNPDFSPVITPILDTDNFTNELAEMSGSLDEMQTKLVGTFQRTSIPRGRTETTSQTVVGSNQNEKVSSGDVIFNQYNTSPKSLSRLEIYRDTSNLLQPFKK